MKPPVGQDSLFSGLQEHRNQSTLCVTLGKSPSASKRLFGKTEMGQNLGYSASKDPFTGLIL